MLPLFSLKSLFDLGTSLGQLIGTKGDSARCRTESRVRVHSSANPRRRGNFDIFGLASDRQAQGCGEGTACVKQSVNTWLNIPRS